MEFNYLREASRPRVGPARRRSAGLVWAVAAVTASLLTAGCGNQGCGEDTSSDRAGPGRVSAGSAPARAGGAPVLELLAPGAEPRRQLRYRLVPGAEETLVMKMRMGMRTKAPEVPAASIETPIMKMTMHLRITAMLSDTEAHYEFSLQDTAVERSRGMSVELMETTRAALAQAEGMAGSAIIDTRGFNRDLVMKLPSGMPPQMEQMMDGAASQGIDRMSTPLPAGAVGEGARWKLHQTLVQNGVELRQETLFELVELDGDRCKLKSTVTQTGARQPMSVPGMPAGAVELMGLQSAGAGELELDLARLVPNSTLTLGSEYTMQIATEELQVVEAHLDMSMEIARR